MRALFFLYALFHLVFALLFLSGRPVWFPGGPVPALCLLVSVGLLISSVRLSTHFVSSRRIGITCLTIVWLGYAAWLWQFYFATYFVAGNGPGADPLAGLVALFGMFLIGLFLFTTRAIFWLRRLTPQDLKPRRQPSDLAGTPWENDPNHTSRK